MAVFAEKRGQSGIYYPTDFPRRIIDSRLTPFLSKHSHVVDLPQILITQLEVPDSRFPAHINIWGISQDPTLISHNFSHQFTSSFIDIMVNWPICLPHFPTVFLL